MNQEDLKEKDYNCPSCGEEKPNYRGRCPHCGYRDKKISLKGE
jgi:predicted ATP-dependent serine protease